MYRLVGGIGIAVAIEAKLALLTTHVDAQTEIPATLRRPLGASRQLAERRLDAEQRKFAAGTSTSFQVFQAQRDLSLARTNCVPCLTTVAPLSILKPSSKYL